MARGVNKVILIGNLGADPETRFMPSGGAVTNVRLATSETWKDKQSGQMQERTEWHRVVFFNKLGEIAGEYLKKGSKVYIDGSIRTPKWKGQDGKARYTTEIVANEMQMLDGRGDGGGGQGGGYASQGNQGGYQNQNENYGGGNAAPQQNQNPSPNQNQGGFSGPADDFDDDIPF